MRTVELFAGPGGWGQGVRIPRLLIPLAPPAWPAEGLCAQTDPAMFFPKKGGSTRDAKKVCGLCDVRAECLEWALYVGEPDGVWGGLSVNEREDLVRKAAA